MLPWSLLGNAQPGFSVCVPLGDMCASGVQQQCHFGLSDFVWSGLRYCLEFFLYFYIFEKNTSKVFLFCIEEANVGCRDLL